MAAKTVLLGLFLVSLAGCRSSESRVSGLVTVNGQPLERGYITFYPVEGPAAVQGVEITAGRYEIKKLKPGRRRALIAATPDARIVHQRDGTPTLQLAASANPVSAQMAGNQQIVEIGSGAQSLDFSLQSPLKR